MDALADSISCDKAAARHPASLARHPRRPRVCDALRGAGRDPGPADPDAGQPSHRACGNACARRSTASGPAGELAVRPAADGQHRRGRGGERDPATAALVLGRAHRGLRAQADFGSDSRGPCSGDRHRRRAVIGAIIRRRCRTASAADPVPVLAAPPPYGAASMRPPAAFSTRWRAAHRHPGPNGLAPGRGPSDRHLLGCVALVTGFAPGRGPGGTPVGPVRRGRDARRQVNRRHWPVPHRGGHACAGRQTGAVRPAHAVSTLMSQPRALGLEATAWWPAVAALDQVMDIATRAAAAVDHGAPAPRPTTCADGGRARSGRRRGARRHRSAGQGGPPDMAQDETLAPVANAVAGVQATVA